MVDFSWPWATKRTSDIVWLDLGDLGDLVNPSGPHEQWQDHGLGLLRTILHQNGIQTDVLSTRAVTSWDKLAKQLQGYDTVIMNVRSYTFPVGTQGGPTLQADQSKRHSARGRNACDCGAGRDGRGRGD